MKLFAAVAAAALALPIAAHAQRYGRYPPQYAYQPQARQGLLFSMGLGGSSMYLSNEGRARIGAGDVDFRLGYGLSDRLQMFMDFSADEGTTYRGDSVGSWTWTMRGQTLLIGDRAGNGLNANFGVGFGGLTYDTGNYGSSSGIAVGGGLSFDARITRNCSFSPEFFFTWHEVPNDPSLPSDIATTYGLRLSLLWYFH